MADRLNPLEQAEARLERFRQRQAFEIPTTSEESFRNLLSSISSTQRARKGLKALGAEEKPKERQGILSRLFSQEKGILTAPARAVTAFAADVLKLPVGDEEAAAALEQYNPFEAAARSLRGEFAVTGGDIIKVNDDDSFEERLAKWAGALAIDITTDPISYVGPVNLFTKKGAAVLAVRSGDNMLAVTNDLLQKAGRVDDASRLVDDLFTKSRLSTAADAQRRLGLEVTQGSPMDILKMSPEGVVSAQVKANHAASQLGLLVGESLLTGGRAKVRRTIGELLGSDDLARQFMERLPAEVAGGIFIKNPFSGRALSKIAGGVGAGGPAMELVNQARFALSASKPFNFFTENFAGKSGVVYAKVKRGLLPKAAMSATDRTTLLDFATFKKALSERNVLQAQLSMDMSRILSGVLATKKAFTAQADQEAFEATFRTAFFSPRAPLSGEMTVAQREGAAAAANVRAAVAKAHADLKAAGIEVGDLGSDYTPLMLTDEAYERKAARGYQGGTAREDYQYTGGERRSLAEYSEDPETRAILGSDAPDRPNVVFLNAVEANKRLRKAGKIAEDQVEFEEDPIKVAQMYLNWANGALSAKKFVDTAAKTGAILRFPRETRTLVDTVEASTLLSAAKKLSPVAAKRAEALKAALREKLEAALDPKLLEQLQADVVVRRGEALTSYRDSKVAEEGARQELLRANRAVEAAAQRLSTATPAAQAAAGGPNVEALVSEAQRVYNNARSRLSKAADRAETTEAGYEALASRMDLPGPVSPEGDMLQWYDELADADVRALQARQKLDDELTANQQAREELARAKEFRQSTYQQLDAAQRQAFDTYEQALVAQQRATEAAVAARARRQDALLQARAAAEDTVIARATGLNELVSNYTRAKYKYLDTKARIAKPYKAMSAREKLVFDARREVMKDAHKQLKEMLGYATKRGGAGAEYARTVVRLSEKLPEAEFEAARVLANTTRLNAMIDGLSDFAREDALDQLGTIYNTYKSIRRYLTPEDLRDLARTERRVLAGPFSRVTRKKEAMNRAAEELYSETGIAKIGAGAENAKLRVPKSLRDSFAPEGVRTALERLYRAENDPTEWEKWLSKIYDPAALVWKTGVTVGRGPGYAFTNLVGALTNNFLARISAKSHRLSAIMLERATMALREIQQANPNLSYFEQIPLVRDRLEREIGGIMVGDKPLVELFVDFLERGGHFSTDTFFQMAELQRLGLANIEPLARQQGIQFRFDEAATGPIEDKYRQVVTFMLTNPVQRTFNDIAQLSELFPRFAAYIDGYSNYGNLESAMDLVHMLHFDYQDLTTFELWFKRFIPFYTWTRNNVPLQMRAAFLASDQVAKLYNANAELKEAFDIDGEAAWLNEYLPDFMEINGGFASYLKTGSGYLGLFPKLPMQDVDRFFGTAFVAGIPIPWPRRDAVISSLGPVVKSPTEFVTGRNYDLGYAYGSDAELLQGQIRTLVPYWGTAKRVLSGLGLPIEQEKRVSNLLNVLVGAPYGAVTINEKTLARGAKQTAESVNAQLRAAAEDANVDIEWLRKQLKDGVPLHQLTLMIGTGQGAPDRVSIARKLDEMTKKPRGTDYTSTLRELRGVPQIPTLGL